MVITDQKVARWKDYASIFASFATPFVVVGVAYFIQAQFSAAGLAKDYVQIAINVLFQDPGRQDKDIRVWAVTTLEKYSPVPSSGASSVLARLLAVKRHPNAAQRV